MGEKHENEKQATYTDVIRQQHDRIVKLEALLKDLLWVAGMYFNHTIDLVEQQKYCPFCYRQTRGFSLFYPFGHSEDCNRRDFEPLLVEIHRTLRENTKRRL